jgi:hypothetical protein
VEIKPKSIQMATSPSSTSENARSRSKDRID